VSDGHGGEDGREVLGQGSEPGRWASWSASRPRLAAALFLVAAAGAGYGANELFDESGHTAPAVHGDRIVAGMLGETPDSNPAAMVVPLRNESQFPVTVHEVHPEGWRAYGDDVMLPPGEWVDVPIWLTLECGRMPEPTRRLRMLTVPTHDVGVSRSTPRTLRLPEVPRALDELRHRLCDVPLGDEVERDRLVGTWQVKDGRSYGGHLFFRFDGNGRFSLSSDGRLDQQIMATGRGRLLGDWLRLEVDGGWFCEPGDSIVWRIGLLTRDRIRIGHQAYFDDVCQVDEREVWVARRIR
jgi:hypothetical protein